MVEHILYDIFLPMVFIFEGFTFEKFSEKILEKKKINKIIKIVVSIVFIIFNCLLYV